MVSFNFWLPLSLWLPSLSSQRKLLCFCIKSAALVASRTMKNNGGWHREPFMHMFFFDEVGHTLWQKLTLFLSKGHFFSTRRSTTELVQTLPTFLRIMLLLRYAVACHEWGPFMRRLWAIEASNSLGWIGFFPNHLHYIDMFDVW